MTARTLVLDTGYQPHRVVTWQRAAQLLHDGRAEVVELYGEALRALTREAVHGLRVSKQMLAWFEMGGDQHVRVLVVRMPAVIRLLGIRNDVWTLAITQSSASRTASS